MTINDVQDGVTITATGTVDPSITGVSNEFDVIGAADYFEFDNIDSPQTAGEAFTITITAYTSEGDVATDYTGIAELSDTTGTIDPTNTGNFVDGVWSGDVTINMADTGITITGTDNEISGVSNEFEITHGMVDSIVISPAPNATVEAGEDLLFTAEAYDAYGNLITDDITDFEWENAEEGVFNEENTGDYDVTATYEGVTSEPTTVTVILPEAVDLIINPDGVTIDAGSVQEYTAEALDTYGNRYDVTNDTEFSIDKEAGGTWFDNVYSSEIAGEWTVTGTYDTFVSTVTLTVESPSVDYIVISPDFANITAGETETYTAEAYDEFGNFVADVTAYSHWEIEGGAGGGWDENIYTSEFAGTWTVTGSYGKSQDNATLTVAPADIDCIAVRPKESTIVAGASQEYNAATYDAFGNEIDDITEYVVWSIEEEAGGRWEDNIYTSFFTGTWTVTGTYGPYEDTAVLTVESTDLDPAMFEIFIVSGDEQVKTAGTQLDEPLIVEVRDHFGASVGMGWKVWFNITTEGLNGDGELSRTSPVLTDVNGTANVLLTLDSVQGENEVTAEISGAEASKSVVFTATGTLPHMEVELSVNVDRATSGDVVVFKIQMENTGTESASNAWISIELGDKLSYVSDTSDGEYSVIEDIYRWHLIDIEVGIHRFDVVCKIGEVREKHVMNTSVTLEYTDAEGYTMPTVTSNQVSFEIDVPLLDKIYWPLPLIPLILAILGGAWYVYKNVEIEEVFLIYRSGILIAHKSINEDSGMEEDIFSSMLKVIQDFVKDSFREEGNYGIKRLEFGKRRILIQKGRYTFMAVVFNGRVVGAIEKKMENVLKKLETEYDSVLQDWSGRMSDIDGVEEYLEEFF